MAALIIESNDKKNLQLISQIAKKLGGKVKSISIENMEDLIFGEMIQEAKTGEFISNDEFMKSLK